jgi:hypothetical protein
LVTKINYRRIIFLKEYCPPIRPYHANSFFAEERARQAALPNIDQGIRERIGRPMVQSPCYVADMDDEIIVASAVEFDAPIDDRTNPPNKSLSRD